MEERRTYIDASVLIAAFRGESPTCDRAMQVLSDVRRQLVVSEYLRLEVIPKPSFHKRYFEVQFMKTVLESAAVVVEPSLELVSQAVVLASRYDLTPLDALHLSAAISANADEFVTLEKPTRPLCRVQEIRVISLHSPPKSPAQT